MKRTPAINIHNEEALTYDQQTLDYEYFAPDTIFGMCYEFIKPGERLLDVGIGTGLSSRLFARAGLEIYGLDGSEQMLDVCKAKDFAHELKCVDITSTPWPYPDRFFPCLISCGVFHFFPDLDFAMREVSRIICKRGLFAFTAAVPPAEEAESQMKHFVKVDTSWGVPIYAHLPLYLMNLLQKHGFKIFKKQRLIMKGGTDVEDGLIFMIYVAQFSISQNNK
jgi:predicted TPR repeat methyltransferase